MALTTTMMAWWEFLVAGAECTRLRARGWLAQRVARFALWLSRHSERAITEAEQARRILEVTRAAYDRRAALASRALAPSASASSPSSPSSHHHAPPLLPTPLPAVIALPTLPRAAGASMRDAVDASAASGVSGVWRVRTQLQPALPAMSAPPLSPSHAKLPPVDTARSPRAPHSPFSGREATPPGSASSFPSSELSLGGVSAFAHAMGRDADPAFPNVRAVTLALTDALFAIEQQRMDMLAVVAENLASAALQIPRHVDAALFGLLPSPPLPPAADAPDTNQPAWLAEIFSAPTMAPPEFAPEQEQEQEPQAEPEPQTESTPTQAEDNGAAGVA